MGDQMRKLKPQYEEFCRAYVDSANAGWSAAHAGYMDANRYHQGMKLLARPEIVARIHELRGELAERESLHVESLLAKLETAYRQSLTEKNTLATVRVIELQAKLAGLVGSQSVGKGGARTETIADAAAEADALLAAGEPAPVPPKAPARKIARRAAGQRRAEPATPAVETPAAAPDVAPHDAFAILPGELPERATAPESDGPAPDPNASDARMASESVAEASSSESASLPAIHAGQPDEVRRAALLAVARSRRRKSLNRR
jgi:phage terminase small subunit